MRSVLLGAKPALAPRYRVALIYLVGVVAVTGLVASSIAVTPPGALWTSWWPIVGFGVGVGVQSDRRYHVPISLLSGASAGTAILWSGLPLQAAAVGIITISAAVFVAIRLIRPRDHRAELLTIRDLSRLFAGAGIAGIVVGVLSFVFAAAGGQTAIGLVLIARTAPEMAAGILLVAPLFMRLPRVTSSARAPEIAAQWLLFLCVFSGVFGVSLGLPLAWLAVPPLVWAAARLPLRLTMLQLVTGAAIISIVSERGRGPFSTATLGTDVSIVMVQAFNLTIAFVFLSMGAVVAARAVLADALAKIEAAARETEREELERAAEVQRALLPRVAFPASGFVFAGVCIPSRTVGGDFYDWQPISDGFAITLGDVMGKGVGAGMLAAAVRTAVRMDDTATDAAAAIARASRLLEADLAESSSFVTLFHARVSVDDGSLSFADAGHGLTIILRPDGSTYRLFSDDLPLGLSDSIDRRSTDLTMMPGDMLVSVSDGVLDLWDGTLASLDHVAEIARGATSPQHLVDLISELAKRSSTPDDITVIAVMRTP